ncbi:kinase-like domain-containing protein [Xylaria digitata]|nr:kinase-like domain-containing protein [Xylaria digitata]
MVRRLDFVDGVSWVARVRLPLEATFASVDSYNSQRAFKIEVASMKFFKSKSTIPVPEIFAYDHDPSNRVGAPYMLMEYVHGTMAYEQQFFKHCTPSTFGTLEQDQRFRQQMAKIQAQMLAFQFPKIGSLYYDEDTESFFIGPDMITGKGPWESSADYYRDLTDTLLKEMAARYHDDAENTRPFYLPVLLNHLMSIHGKQSNGLFSLVNRDFGTHNILVDNDFNILAVIDFDGIFAAPPEAGAQYPIFSGMRVDLPDKAETNPYVLERIEQTKPKLIEYRELMMKYESEFMDGNVTTSSLLGSQAALIYQGFEECRGSLGTRDEKWHAAAIEMLREYAEAQGSS